MSVKLEKQDERLLRKIVDLRREDISSFMRRAIRLEFARLGYLADEELKALGMEAE